MPNNPANTSHYSNQLDFKRYLTANYTVKQVGFSVASFDTEPGVDYLDYRAAGDTNGAQLTGVPALMWYDKTLPRNAQTTPLEFRFYSNASVTRPGFILSRARVCSEPVPAGIQEPTQMDLLRRYYGLLLGAGDVIFFKAPARGTAENMHLAMVGGGTNFDVYAKCNAVPTPSSFTYTGLSADSHELLILDNSLCENGTWYFAVRSTAGAGTFHMYLSPSFKGKGREMMRVGLNWAGDINAVQTIAETVKQSARYFYGFTEGQYLIKRFEVFNNTGSSCDKCGGYVCDICFKNAPGTAMCCAGSQYVIAQGYFSKPKGVAHEYGHGELAIWDEYWTSESDTGCGHSVMASTGTTNNNFCYKTPGGSGDHGFDRSGALTAEPAVWEAGRKITVQCPVIPSETPDNYSFADFDFAGLIDVVIR